ncbi:MAG: DUF493 domain-containing protein [Flavobacteriaceae bacterium]|nr:DUF493 domain-containing protein [Flavobacteriaceae bacterium]
MKVEEFYKKLKNQLEEHHNFPENYLYKFILPNGEGEKLSELYKVFDGLKYSLNTKESSNGKYISISISCFVLSADQVIKIYKEAGKIEGIIML